MKTDIERLKILMTEIDIGLGYRFDFKENTCIYMDGKAIVERLPI